MGDAGRANPVALLVVSLGVSTEDSELAAPLAWNARLDGRIQLLFQDACSLPAPDGILGCAVMPEDLHHLDDAWPVLPGMARLVRPGGIIGVAESAEGGFDGLRAPR